MDSYIMINHTRSPYLFLEFIKGITDTSAVEISAQRV